MGWLDLIQFTILIDDENEDAKRRLREFKATHPTNPEQLQRL